MIDDQHDRLITNAIPIRVIDRRNEQHACVAPWIPTAQRARASSIMEMLDFLFVQALTFFSFFFFLIKRAARSNTSKTKMDYSQAFHEICA